MAIKAVAFDVFGTLVRIERPTRPFRKLVRLLHEAGRRRQSDDGIRAMCNAMDLRQTARRDTHDRRHHRSRYARASEIWHAWVPLGQTRDGDALM